MRRAMDDRAAVIGHGRTFVPNLFTIELATTDFERLTGFSEMLTDELVASAQEHAESQRYQPGGPIQVDFTSKDDLETGVFRVRPSTAKGAKAAAAGAPAATPSGSPQPSGAGAAEPAAEDWAPASPAAAAVNQARVARDESVAPARSQAPVQRPWLDVDGDRYPLLGAITVLGRDNIADIVLDDPGISRQHTEIRVTSDGPHLVARIRDLGSTNGTFVNGERVSSHRLNDGDRVTVGRTALIYRAERR
jgi:hypothetical protein